MYIIYNNKWKIIFPKFEKSVNSKCLVCAKAYPAHSVAPPMNTQSVMCVREFFTLIPYTIISYIHLE